MLIKRFGIFIPILIAIAFWAVFMMLPAIFPPRGPLDLSNYTFANASSPSLEPGALGTWDSYSIHAPSVLKVNGGHMMWYDGTTGSDPYAGWSIGAASSRNGRAWTKDAANPVLTPGAQGEWDGVSVHDPRVLRDNKEYWMWYSGFDGKIWRIGLAISPDGVNWQKSASNPIMDGGSPGSWDEAGAAYSSVIYIQDTFYMWYQGLDSKGVWRIGRATSRNGINWTKDERNPVLIPGGTGAWDEEKVLAPSVLYSGGSYHLWYTGAPAWAIGYAVSGDGITWRKKEVPVLLSAGNWDKGRLLTAAALFEGGRPVLWYAGGDNGRISIGIGNP
ncbi:MAG: hypothetical protein EXR50_03555 [Dehalococcoidia bacterium]|nr:hypothetical protein [Dehalococcoidia bacterium]